MPSSSQPYSPVSASRRRIKQHTEHSSDEDSVTMLSSTAETFQHGQATALNGIHVPPRTPRSGQRPHREDDADGRTEEVEMSLLQEDERREAQVGVDDEATPAEKPSKPMSKKDKRGMMLLITLYLIQGVPLGLALGSVPFLLRDHLNYAELGVFSLSSYPYSLKLLWSPIVDSKFSRKIGRRKSWIVPMQIIIGTMMLWISFNVVDMVKSPIGHVTELTVIWTSLVFMAATQDIAVDGWALTLLSPENVGYASTAQTVGLNTGYFASFTVFLALNSPEFAKKIHLPPLSLARYLQFWACICYTVTVWLVFFKKEDPEAQEDDDLQLKKVYKSMWSVIKLKHVQLLCAVHFVAKIAYQAHEGVTHLKMVEKGLGKEDLAMAVLIDFPFQIAAGYFAARWSIGDKPLRPWLWAFWFRIGFAIIAMLMIFGFPPPPLPRSFFALIVITTVLGGFAATIQFVGISAFHTRISDPLIGGTYMTLLNTAANIGGTWPRYFVLKAVDSFSVAHCHVKDKAGILQKTAHECVTHVGKDNCKKELHGTCVIERDGYYTVSIFCIILGTIIFVAFVIPVARRLQALPVAKWRVKLG